MLTSILTIQRLFVNYLKKDIFNSFFFLFFFLETDCSVSRLRRVKRSEDDKRALKNGGVRLCPPAKVSLVSLEGRISKCWSSFQSAKKICNLFKENKRKKPSNSLHFAIIFNQCSFMEINSLEPTESMYIRLNSSYVGDFIRRFVPQCC